MVPMMASGTTSPVNIGTAKRLAKGPLIATDWKTHAVTGSVPRVANVVAPIPWMAVRSSQGCRPG